MEKTPNNVPGSELEKNEARISRALERTKDSETAPVLRLVCGDNEPTQNLLTKIEAAGYTIVDVTADKINDEAFMQTVRSVVASQKGYAESAVIATDLEHLGPKVALLFRPGMFETCLEDENFKLAWGFNLHFAPNYSI